MTVPVSVPTASTTARSSRLSTVKAKIRKPMMTRFQNTGAIAALLLEGARRIFSIYVDRVATYDIVYGSIGSIIVFLFFVYIAGMVILYGAEFGASLRRVHNAGRVLRPGA